MHILTKAHSITHLHILAVVNSEIGKLGKYRIRILDLGCGDGRLTDYLYENLKLLRPGTEIDLYGLDVHDHGVQARNYFGSTLTLLAARFPEVSWTDRLHLVSTRDHWPYDDGFFDIIVSNQVLEHVDRHDFVFAQIRRCLADGGFSVHVFPLKHYIREGHLLLPWAHRFSDRDLLVRYIRFMSRLGLGKYPDHRRRWGVSVDEFAEQHADYMKFYTNYLSYDGALELARREKLRASYRYTQELYWSKARSILGLRPRTEYRLPQWGVVDWMMTAVFKYFSSVTLFLEKKQTYRAQPW